MMGNPIDLSRDPQQAQARRFRQIEEDNGYPIKTRQAGGAGAGPTGPAGVNGATWFSGAGVPSAGEGANGDFYLRISNQDVYKKSGGTWTIITNLKGEKGETGAKGAEGTAGTNGTNGATGPAGTAAPAADLATAVALPANTRTVNVLEANAVGVWTIDGGTLSVNAIILVKNEATGANNGVYKVVTVGTAGVKTKLERDTTMNESAKAVPGMLVYVARGNVNSDSVWQLTADPTITLNTTALTWAPVSNFTEMKTASGALVTTEAYLEVPGVTFTTPFASNWDVRFYVDAEIFAAGFGLLAVIQIAGVESGMEVHAAPAGAGGRFSVSGEQKTGFLAAGTVIRLVARRGASATTVQSGHTRMFVSRTM